MTAPLPNFPPHAVARLRAQRLARSAKPFVARGANATRCAGCRVIPSHCFCALRRQVSTDAGFCLIMCDIEPIKPTNTGWLIADVVPDTYAFGWARTEVDPALLALLADPQWAPILVFPQEYVAPERVITQVSVAPARRPLFILLDGTWPEACKMARKSPYLDPFPVLGLQPDQRSRYRLRRALREQHICTSEVAALCLELAGEAHAADTLSAYLDVFTGHYLHAKQSTPVDADDAAHQRLRALAALGTKGPDH